MTPLIPLHTERLLLRDFQESDLPVMFALMSDPIFMRYEGLPDSEEQTRTRLELNLSSIQAEPRKEFRLVITQPPENQMIGYVSLRLNHADISEWEIGWGVAPARWGQGIASEAARAVLRFAFDTLNVNRVVAFCHVDNTASWRVMEKIGMQREGRLREQRWLNGEKFDEYLYAILRSD